jgi:hypothetical protein
MKERVIRKITVQAGGLKGLILEGEVESVKENKVVTNGFKDTVRHPINRDLEEKINELRFFGLNICGLITDSTPKNEKLTLIEGCDVISLEFERGVAGYFKIKVASRVFDTKTITLTTPKTDSSDDYEWFDEVMKIIDSLLEEVDQYSKGLKKISDEDLMISFIRHGKNKEMTMDKLNEMSAEDRVNWLVAECEKYGCLVMQPDEIYETKDAEEVSLETKAEEPLMLEVSGDDVEPVTTNLEIDSIDKKGNEELKIAEPIKLKATK